MTPLAQRHLRSLLDGEAGSGASSRREMLKLMEDIHCFEVTAALPMLAEIKAAADKLSDPGEMYRGRTFLPAPKTWIEWTIGNRRFALLLIEGEGIARAILVMGHGFFELGWISTEADDYSSNGNEILMYTEFLHVKPEIYLAAAHRLLILINTPRIIGRRQHMPHRGLERELLRKQKWVGKFPLHAWTEIKLSISKPTEIDDGEPHEAHLTGRRALHFCRAHLRFRCGQLEYVTSHWRGDPALGIKQSRYKLCA